MTDLRNYVENVPFAEMAEDKFAQMIKLNATFGESFATNGYYLYCLKKLYSKTLIPSTFYSDNYPNLDARIAFCKTKYMIVSPGYRDESERISYYSSVTKDGVIILNDESPPVSPVKCVLDRKLDNDDFTDEHTAEFMTTIFHILQIFRHSFVSTFIVKILRYIFRDRCFSA